MELRTAARLAIVAVLGAMAISSARGDSLLLASVGTDTNPRQTNSSGYTVPVKKSRDWAPPIEGSSWVSFASTGDPADPKFKAVPTGTVVTFFDVFNISQYASGGTLRVMADDSASVILNGTMICPDTAIGGGKAVNIDLPANLLRIGANTLEFRVAQRRGVSFGLDYSGMVNFKNEIYAVGTAPFISGGYSANPPPPSGGGGNPAGPPPPSTGGAPFNPQPPNGGAGTPIPVPEPSSLAMLCAGIVATIVLAQWRARNDRSRNERRFHG